MINDKQINTLRDNWIKASKALGFKILSPYKIIINGQEEIAFAFLPAYGSKKGTIVGLTSPPEYKTDKKISVWAMENECFCSFLNVEGYLIYDEQFIIETLEDWGKFTS